MSAKSERSVGDLLLAFGRLRPRNARTREAIVRRLGFAPTTKAVSAAKRKSAGAGPVAGPGVGPANAPPAQSTLPGPRPPLEPQLLASGSAESGWLSGESLSRVDPAHVQAPLPFEPLLPPGQERGLLFHAVATSAETGPIDIERLVRWLATGKPIASLPRLRAPSLFRGADLLVDLGEAMEPYARDQRELTDTLRRVVGPASLRVLQFRSCPVRGAGPGAAWTWRPYLRPNGHRPALVLGGLGHPENGIGRDAGATSEWARLGRAFARQRVPLVVLTPYALPRVPTALRRDISVVHWDRSLSLSAVRQARHRVGH